MECFESWVQKQNKGQSVFLCGKFFSGFCATLALLHGTVYSFQSSDTPQCAVVRVYVLQGGHCALGDGQLQ